MSAESRELVVTGVSKHFGGVAALTDVSIGARRGEITGLIGPNGAGKTTLFNVITGFHRADSGTVAYGDRELTRLSPNRIAMAGVVRTFQDIHIFKGMTALENLEVGVRRSSDLDEALDMLRLTARTRGWGIPLDVPVASLSFGDQKVVAMARTLALGASAVLLDEPASGLDEGSIEVLLVLLRSFMERGKLVLIVEHNMGLVMSICDRLFVLANGSVLAEGTPAEIQKNRAVIDAYLGGGGAIEDEQEVLT
jgi:ABC-type branched-subunit amino acid transport system ATPase component